MIRIAITGATGRMGCSLVQACQQTPDFELSVATARAPSAAIGSDAGQLAGVGPLGVTVIGSLEGLTGDFDVLIDFTRPEATMEHVAICRQAGKPIVIGTTGFSADERRHIEAASASIPIVLAPNMSVGVNVAYKLVELAARVLGNDADIEIIEAHHRNKLDAPSGTALQFGELIAKTLGRDLQKCAVYGRAPGAGVKRDHNTIGFETIRAGDIVGDHTILFAGTGERLEITHKASSRLNFALGALRAAGWLTQHKKGLFDMQDVLGLK